MKECCFKCRNSEILFEDRYANAEVCSFWFNDCFNSLKERMVF